MSFRLRLTYASDITFSWEKPSSYVSAYDLWLAFDKDFKEVAKRISVSSTSSTVSQIVGSRADAGYDFMPGETYYWKVRVSSSGPIYSGWSEVRLFSIEKAEVTPPVIIEPAPAPEITIEVPTVVVELPPTLPPTPAEPAAAPIAATYLWAIIGIGAVLVLALIVLIVRTRRVA